MKLLFRLVVCCFLLHSGAVHSASGCELIAGGPINFNTRWPQVWTALTERSNCTQNCHLGGAPSGDLALGDLAISIYFLVHQPSSQNNAVARVEPGNAKASLFFQKVNCAVPDVGGRMPPGGHLPTDLQALIFDWIEQGGYGESPEDPITRDFVFRDSLESLRR